MTLDKKRRDELKSSAGMWVSRLDKRDGISQQQRVILALSKALLDYEAALRETEAPPTIKRTTDDTPGPDKAKKKSDAPKKKNKKDGDVNKVGDTPTKDWK